MKPVTLRCGHSGCMDCLNSIISLSSNTSVSEVHARFAVNRSTLMSYTSMSAWTSWPGVWNWSTAIGIVSGRGHLTRLENTGRIAQKRWQVALTKGVRTWVQGRKSKGTRMTANLENSSVWAAGLWCEGPTSKIMKQTDAITVEWIVPLDVAQSCLGMKDLCICTYTINVPKHHLSIDVNKHIKQR